MSFWFSINCGMFDAIEIWEISILYEDKRKIDWTRTLWTFIVNIEQKKTRESE